MPEDSLDLPFARLHHSTDLPISWAVKFSVKGMDPLHAAWLASEDGDKMLAFIREYFALSHDERIEWRTITYGKLANLIAGAQRYHIRLYGLNDSGYRRGREGARIAAEAMRKVFTIYDVITLSELMAMPVRRR